MKSNGKKDNENTSDGIATAGEKGVKLSGSSAVECELLPFLGCFQPNSSRSFKSFVICSPALSRSHTETLQNHYDEVGKRGPRHNRLHNFHCAQQTALLTLCCHMSSFAVKWKLRTPKRFCPEFHGRSRRLLGNAFAPEVRFEAFQSVFLSVF